MPRRALPRTLLGLSLCALAGLTAGPALGGSAGAGPAFRTYTAPAGLASDAGETSLSVNWKTGAVLLQDSLETDHLTFDAAGNASWREVTPDMTGVIGLDAIGVGDSSTGRMFVSQLVGFGSLMEYSDNDGESWTASQGSGEPAGYDHQSVGVGPYPAGSAKPSGGFPHAVYYCSQEGFAPLCARSDNGGSTFGVATPAYDSASCVAIHGHLRVAPDGTVYLPSRACGDRQGVAVSTDAGQTWTVRTVPDSTAANGQDPSMALGRDGTGYFAYADGRGHPKVAVTRDRGASWAGSVDLGQQLGIVNVAFPEAIAGDGDRAAVAFLGTKTAGDAQDQYFGMNDAHTRYVGAEYHLYIATTYNRGRSWQTVDVTPHDPVQRGRICLAGTTCSQLVNDRNLLDFMDINVDRSGRVLVSWSDGCTGGCVASDLVTSNTFTDKGNVTRQSSGKLLFARPAALTP